MNKTVSYSAIVIMTIMVVWSIDIEDLMLSTYWGEYLRHALEWMEEAYDKYYINA